ncbi:hypothetical protein BCAR13_110181 [Paraburkholderia caribensis]|nr:hypothetical protein BCAR13_110181 [Paraburkholderia caribensis]
MGRLWLGRGSVYLVFVWGLRLSAMRFAFAKVACALKCYAFCGAGDGVRDFFSCDGCFVLSYRRFGMLAFSLASALRYLTSGVAPVRGGTYFSLPPQRKVGAAPHRGNA